MNSPSFKSAMSFTWVEKLSWTTTLLTLICFLHKKSKILKTLGFSTCVVLSLYSDHEGRGWRRGSLQVAALGWTLLRSKTQNDILWGRHQAVILQCQDFERFRYIQSSLIEKDLFVIYAVDTVRGCKHPIVADLRDFVSFSKRNILRKRYCKGNKVYQFAHHIFPPEFRCIWNPRELCPPLVVLQQSKGTQIPGEENEGERG